MKLLVISDAPILMHSEKKVAYAPYVKEMDLWMNHASETSYVCPTRYDRKLLTQPFNNEKFKVTSLRRLEFHSTPSALISLLTLPYQFLVLCFAFAKADHIHLRCPGNLALLASITQMFFPKKKKTVKYAGNFDPKALQPLAYRWQKNILSNIALTKNMNVLVYGDWPNQTKNIKPFFTATYKREQIVPLKKRDWSGSLKAVFVGTMGSNKRPIEVFEIVKKLIENGIDISLDYYGDGPLKEEIQEKVKSQKLTDRIVLHGNVDNSIVTEAYKNAHFSFLLSKSEGWPKAVAEAMFWGCIPVASKVSCVPWMLGHSSSELGVKSYELMGEVSNSKAPDSDLKSKDKETYPLGLGKGFDAGQRGILISDISKASIVFKEYLKVPELLEEMSARAANWSQQYTLDDFEEAIQELLKQE